MSERRKRLTLGRMMIGVGVVALILALRRVDAAPGVSLFVFVACAWYLAARRYAETMARRAAEGLTTSPAEKARILAGAASLAVVAIGLPDAAFLASYYGYMKAIRATIVMTHWVPDYDPRHMMMGAFLGIVAALYVSSIVRRWTGPIVSRKPAAPAAVRPAREPMRSRLEQKRVAAQG